MDKFAEDKGHILDILKSIEEIQSYVGGASFDDFNQREGMREHVYYLLQTIGGAYSLLSDEFKDQYRDIDWDVLYNLNFGAYNNQAEIESQPVWYIVSEDLPIIHDQIADIATAIENRNDDFIF